MPQIATPALCVNTCGPVKQAELQAYWLTRVRTLCMLSNTTSVLLIHVSGPVIGYVSYVIQEYVGCRRQGSGSEAREEGQQAAGP